MPEPGSKAYDQKRQRLRREYEDQGEPDANERAKTELERDPQYRPSGPRTERGRGPKGEREEPPGGEQETGGEQERGPGPSA